MIEPSRIVTESGVGAPTPTNARSRWSKASTARCTWTSESSASRVRWSATMPGTGSSVRRQPSERETLRQSSVAWTSASG